MYTDEAYQAIKNAMDSPGPVPGRVPRHMENQPQGKKKKRKRSVKSYLLGMCILAAAVLILGRHRWKRMWVVQNLKQSVQAVCTQYGLEQVQTKVSLNKESYIWYGELSVSSEDIQTLENSQKYELLLAIEDLDRDLDEDLGKVTVLTADLITDGREYDLNPEDKYALRLNGRNCYVVPEEAERRFLSSLENKDPYVGLEEKYIDSTRYGHHDETYYCTGFHELPVKERTITYRWLNGDGSPKLDAVVGYWSEYKQTETEGMIQELIPYGHGGYVHIPAATAKPVQRYGSTDESDPFEVENYPDAQEFYYYHYDDFYDYEDAEEYYNEHMG